MDTLTAEATIVYKTLDYNKFSFLGGNREINKLNYKRLLKSISEEQLLIPIIVNEKFEIIDGQHRFHVNRDLENPIYYIINKGYGLEQVKRANSVGVNWTKDDFLKTYIEEGNENYIELDRIKKKYGLQIGAVLKIFSAFQNKSDYYTKDKFIKGDFVIGEYLEGIIYFCEQLEMFASYKEYKANAFISAFLKLYLYEDYNPVTMEKQARWIENFKPKMKSQEALLEDLCRQVYSYRLVQGQIFYSKDIKKFFN